MRYNNTRYLIRLLDAFRYFATIGASYSLADHAYPGREVLRCCLLRLLHCGR